MVDLTEKQIEVMREKKVSWKRFTDSYYEWHKENR